MNRPQSSQVSHPSLSLQPLRGKPPLELRRLQSSRIGTCDPVTGFFSGEQSTVTTTIAPDVPRITGVLEKDNFGREDIDLGPMEEDTVNYFAEMFEKRGTSSNSTKVKPPKPSCDMYAYKANAKCMELFSASFCNTVDKDKTEAVSRNLTYEDVVGGAKRAVATGAERRAFGVDSRNAYGMNSTLNGLALMALASGSATSTSGSKAKTAEPKPTTTDVKFEVRNPKCNSEDAFRDHADISSRAAKEVIEEACSHSSD